MVNAVNNNCIERWEDKGVVLENRNGTFSLLRRSDIIDKQKQLTK